MSLTKFIRNEILLIFPLKRLKTVKGNLYGGGLGYFVLQAIRSHSSGFALLISPSCKACYNRWSIFQQRNAVFQEQGHHFRYKPPEGFTVLLTSFSQARRSVVNDKQ